MKNLGKELWKYKAYRLKKCKPLIFLFCVSFAVTVTLGNTSSWFTSSDAQTNEFFWQREEERVIEAESIPPGSPIPPPLPSQPLTAAPPTAPPITTPPPSEEPSPMPSAEPTGIIIVRAGVDNLLAADQSVLVRVLVTPVFVIEHPSKPPTVLPAVFGEHVMIENLNTVDWADGQDGYFYYLHLLKPEESTDTDWKIQQDHILFNTLRVVNPLPSEYENAQLRIEIKYETVAIHPQDAFINTWWNGVTPTQADDPLKAVHDALYKALDR